MGWHQPTSSAVVTSGFGPRTAVKTSNGKLSTTNHLGTDYRAGKGTNVFAIGDGTVTTVAEHSARGKYLIIEHPDGNSSLYQHLSGVTVAKGAKVKAGAVVGKAGATGNTTGAHLHLEVFGKSGQRVNPVQFLRDRLSAPQTAPQPPARPTTPAPTGSAGSGPRTLSFGSNGEDVRELQRVLNAWYPQLPRLVEDGDFGAKTQARVRYAQHRAGLADDGVVGPATRKLLGL